MKTIFFILVLACLNIQPLFSDQKEELETKVIRKQINEIKAKRNKVEANKKAIFELQEDMLGSSVIDENTLTIIEEASQIINSVVNEDIALANHALLRAEMGSGANRESELKNATSRLSSANEKLDKIKSLLALKANKAFIIEKIIELILQNTNNNQQVLTVLEKELSGIKLDFDIYNDVSKKQNKISNDIKMIQVAITNMVATSIELTDKQLFLIISNIILEEKLLENSIQAEKNLLDKNLMNADVLQKKVTLTLESILKLLQPNNTNEAKPENDNVNQLTSIIDKIQNQNSNLEDVVEKNTGQADITSDPNFDNTLKTQNNINSIISSLLQQNGINPEVISNLKTAQTAIEQGKNDLDNAEPEKAIQANLSAANAIEKALRTIDKNSNKKNNDKNVDTQNSNSMTSDEMSFADVSEFKENQPEYSTDTIKAIFRANLEQLGAEPTEKEVWVVNHKEKNKVVFFQTLISKTPKEFFEPTQNYFVALAEIVE